MDYWNILYKCICELSTVSDYMTVIGITCQMHIFDMSMTRNCWLSGTWEMAIDPKFSQQTTDHWGVYLCVWCCACVAGRWEMYLKIKLQFQSINEHNRWATAGRLVKFIRLKNSEWLSWQPYGYILLNIILSNSLKKVFTVPVTANYQNDH